MRGMPEVIDEDEFGIRDDEFNQNSEDDDEDTEPPPNPVTYTALSYVWRGNTLFVTPNFMVKATESRDPLSIDTIRHACLASLQRKATYIWLGRLCILQTNKEDKAWQIGNMVRIYQCCRTCLILPWWYRPPSGTG